MSDTGQCTVDCQSSAKPALADDSLSPLPTSTASLNSLDVSDEDLERKIRQFLDEGAGECLFHFGPDEKLEENDLNRSGGLNKQQILDKWSRSEETLKQICLSLNADGTLLRRKKNGGADFLIRKNTGLKDFIEIRVAVVGNVDAGKSTLLGVLTHGELDNGRGHARLKLFRHKHEIESGRTSSVGNDILGFDSKGNVVNKPDPHGSQLNWAQICEDASKVVTFIDLAGHERYLKTTIFGMTGHAPDYCMLMVGANAGVIGMTKEHLGLALALNVPVFVVVTKVDMCPANVLDETMKVLMKLLKSPGCRKLHVLVQNVEHVLISATNFMSERICPIFRVSNVTGENLDLLKMFLNLLMIRFKCDRSEPAEFQIDDTYAVPGVGTVVSGTCTRGLIRLNDVLQLGPDGGGRFISVPIKSIHRKRMPVVQVAGGQTASFALKKVKRSTIRKGMVLISNQLDPVACMEFEADILVLHHPTTISTKYQAMVHCGGVRQTATILSMTRDCLRTGDKASVRFRFIKNPEYLHLGVKLIFREGRTKAVGCISGVIPFVPTVAAAHIKPKRPVFDHSGIIYYYLMVVSEMASASSGLEKPTFADDQSADRNVEMWKIKKLIKSLEAARGNGTSMISLIIPPKDQIPRVSKMLADEFGTASNIKSRVNRLSVLGAITSVQARLKLYNRVPPNGLVIYCGTIVTEEGKEKKVNIDFEPFKAINTSLYLCDNKFHTEALQALLADDSKFGFIVMDGNGCLFGSLQGNTRDVLHKFTVELPKKHGRGGQSALRFARLRMEKRHNYVRKVAETAVQIFMSNDKVNVSGLILAGSADFKTELSQSDMFDQRLQAKIIKVVDVSYGGENGFNQAIELSADTLQNVKFIQEKKLIGRYFEEISQDTSKYVFGVEDTLKALEMGAVEILICWENLDITRYVLKNSQTGEEQILHLTPSQEKDKSHFTDKETGVELELVDSMSFLEWLANNYKNFGATLEIVTDKSQEGAQFVKGFGGIGGLLRYRVDMTMHDVEDNFADIDLDDY